MRRKSPFFAYVALAGVVLLVAVLVAGAYNVRNLQSDTRNQLESIEDAKSDLAQQTLTGCQRGNEIRRAIARIEREFARDCPLCRKALLNIDGDATTVDDCGKTVTVITGVTLPEPVLDFVPNE